MQQTYEAAMLISFSVSWYWSIAKMVRTGQAAGKSAFFVVLICCGYIAGVASKLEVWQATGILSPLIWLYLWNLVVTGIDLVLVLVLTRRAQARIA
ncbi:hypothetical protein [Meridianimarinicoccus roseus]|uniref:hypothetical protein n=1 Tax=Meridianimarinicoccus roseus TaxID=2072018 RepID=UPI001EE65B7A|nr:hypothetical protein [Meridianimarinicoccus roseus]